MSADEKKIEAVIQSSLVDGSFQKAVLSKPVSKSEDRASRIDVRPVQMKKGTQIQLTRRIGRQDHHQNLSIDEAADELLNQVKSQFLDLNLTTSDAEFTARFSRKGVCRLTEKRREPTKIEPAVANHNRTRQYLIPDGIPCPFLIATGVMTKEGQVKAKHYRKFRQINRYVEIVRDIVKDLPKSETIRIVDFGCGKSYLTFATHHLLTNVLNRQVDIRGLDQRADVVATCQRIVDDLQLVDLTFQQSFIAEYQPERHIHLVISLHACDTATDDALANAVQWHSEVILAVPCCQHELAANLDKSSEPLFSDSGILHERFASLTTDALRAQWLKVAGYETSVMEFIDMQHTAKNLLIKAVRRQNISEQAPSEQSPPEKPSFDHSALAADRISAFNDRLNLPTLRLERLLKERKLI